MSKSLKTILQKIGGFSLGPLIGALLSLIIVPIITRFISPEEYGKASMFTLAQGAVSMFMYLGMDQAFAREYVCTEKRDGLLANAMFLPMILAAVIAAFALVFRRLVSQTLFGNPDETLAVVLMAFMFPAMVLETFSFAKIRMDERGAIYSFFTILLKILTLLFTVGLFCVYEKSFRSVVYAAAFAEITNGTILSCMVVLKEGSSVRLINRRDVCHMLRYGVPLVPATMLTWVLTSMDKVMLRTFCDYSELGLYSAAFKIVSVVAVLQSCFTLVWLPVAYRWHETHKEQVYFEMVMKFVTLGMGAVCFGILLCKDLVAWFLGKEFTQAIEIFPFLLLQPFAYTVSETTGIGIAFSRKTEHNIVVAILASVINILLNLWLIPQMGGKGAAVATGISYIVFFWARTLIARRLWWKFPVWFFVLFSGAIIINCGAHTFLRSSIPYIISAVSLLLVFCALIISIKKSKMQVERKTNMEDS